MRIDQNDPEAYRSIYPIERYLSASKLSASHKNLIKIRASQINGCAFCLNMHTREAREAGETRFALFNRDHHGYCGDQCLEPDRDYHKNAAGIAMEVQMRTADVNGIRLRYAICGKGDPLVLLHGFGQDWFSGNRLLPELALRYTVLMPDLRGLGDEVLPRAEGGCHPGLRTLAVAGGA